MAGDFDALDRATAAVDHLAAKLATADGLDWNEQCAFERERLADPADCDSSTCIAAHHEDHDPDVARANYRRYARIAMVGVQSLTSIVLQPWVGTLTLMQQTVLLTAIRGPDGVPKYGPTKMLLRWYRRCTLLSAMDQAVLSNPMVAGGGSFTGPSLGVSDLQNRAYERGLAREHEERGDPWRLTLDAAIADQEEEDGWEPLMHGIVGHYLRELDAIPHHFQLHLLHAAEIVGYKHPDRRIRDWWRQTYERLVHDMHLWPETEDQLDRRLGDNRDQWLERNDVATVD